VTAAHGDLRPDSLNIDYGFEAENTTEMRANQGPERQIFTSVNVKFVHLEI
jgi:hypothetical protein